MFDDALSVLKKPGAIAVIPTDTVYGVVCSATDIAAVERLYTLKQREKKPGTLIAASIDQLVRLGIKRRYLTAVEQFWPGPVSVVVPAVEPELKYLHQDKMSLAVRIPADKKIQELLMKTGPLVTSSANEPGETPATTVAEAKHYFDDKVDLYVDGGNLSGRLSSTVIRIVDDAIEVLREGAVHIDPNN